LNIYYADDKTYVSGYGEVENGEPWSYEGHIEPSVIVAEYLAMLKSVM
jgi:hypothetical protein